MGNYRCFLQGPFPVANYTRIIIPGRFWTRPPATKSTRMASSATPLHDSLIELANPDAHAHAIKWYLNSETKTCSFAYVFWFKFCTPSKESMSQLYMVKKTFYSGDRIVSPHRFLSRCVLLAPCKSESYYFVCELPK